MSEPIKRSIFTSLVVHLGLVAGFFLVTWLLGITRRPADTVFELVAGAGDNWSATKAPALGSEAGREEPVIKPAPQSPPQKTSSSFAQDFERIQEKRYQRKMAQYERQKKAEEAKARKEEQRKAAEEAFKKPTKTPEKTSEKTPQKQGKPVPRIDAKGIASGVTGGSADNKLGGANGKALSAVQADLMERYFAFLKKRIKDAHIPPPGAVGGMVTMVEFHCAASGVISNIRVVRSSGSAEFDTSVVEAIRRVKSVGARPDGVSEVISLQFDADED